MKKNKKEHQGDRTVRQKLADMLELPEDVVLAAPKVTVTGTRHLMIENYKGLIEYTAELMRVQTSDTLISVVGKGMEICAITDTDILIVGTITGVRWE